MVVHSEMENQCSLFNNGFASLPPIIMPPIGEM